jgi:hypothetical protein
MVTGSLGGRISPYAAFRYPVVGFCRDCVEEVRIKSSPFGFDEEAMPEPTNRTKHANHLHICPECGSDLVQPTCWEQAGDRSHWRVWRRCPECEWTCQGVHGENEIDAFDEQLDRGAHELADELRALEHANMADMAEAFIAALDADLLGADDFA